MELNEYQNKAMTTCMTSSANFAYMLLNLVGEVGEFAGKVAKGIRKNGYDIGSNERKDRNQLIPKGDFASQAIREEHLQKEAGDILWQLAGLCKVMGWDLEDIARQNLEKLAARQQNGTIDGNGDGVTVAERI